VAENVGQRSGESYAPEVPSKNLPPVGYKDMPEPEPLRKILGPGVILAGIGVGSGEYILWPYITTQVGLGFLWAVFVGVTIQYFLNMEIERYTLATGETAISGFVRFWKPWGILMIFFALIPNVWPAWATSGAQTLSFLLGTGQGSVSLMSILLLIACGVALTISPVVYQTVEKAEFLKVGLVVLFLIIAIVAAISPSAWADLSQVVTDPILPGDLDSALVLGALAFAGAGGCNNLVQSNWIRDKGFGMGQYIPHIVSPVTGEEEARPATGNMIRQDEENLRRWKVWWKVANQEQLVSFWFICLASILVFSMLAYSTVGVGTIADAPNLEFIRAEGEALMTIVGPWFGNLFWALGTVSLALVSIGVIDYVSRLVADVLITVYVGESERWTESRIYISVVWGMVVVGSLILLFAIDQPTTLVIIASSLSGVVMFIYSILLIQLNRRALPEAIKVKGYRLMVLFASVLFFGYFSIVYIIDKVPGLLGFG
jgi:hypothetical protein